MCPYFRLVWSRVVSCRVVACGPGRAGDWPSGGEPRSVADLAAGFVKGSEVWGRREEGVAGPISEGIQGPGGKGR